MSNRFELLLLLRIGKIIVRLMENHRWWRLITFKFFLISFLPPFDLPFNSLICYRVLWWMNARSSSSSCSCCSSSIDIHVFFYQMVGIKTRRSHQTDAAVRESTGTHTRHHQPTNVHLHSRPSSQQLVGKNETGKCVLLSTWASRSVLHISFAIFPCDDDDPITTVCYGWWRSRINDDAIVAAMFHPAQYKSNVESIPHWRNSK